MPSLPAANGNVTVPQVPLPVHPLVPPPPAAVGQGAAELPPLEPVHTSNDAQTPLVVTNLQAGPSDTSPSEIEDGTETVPIVISAASDPDKTPNENNVPDTEKDHVNPLNDPANNATALDSFIADPNSVAEILQSKGVLTQEQVQALRQDEITSGKTLEFLIDERKLVPEEDLTKARADFYSIPFVKLAETGTSPEAMSMLPESVARRYKMLPFAVNKVERSLSVAMVNPLDLTAIDFATQKTGFRIAAHYATPTEVEQMISERYAQSLSTEVNQALEETPEGSAEESRLEDIASLTNEVVRQAPITKIVETVLAFAIKARASDVHIEPQETKTRVRYRIDGILQEKLVLPKSVQEAVTSRIKILSNLKIDEKRVPQDGRFSFTAGGQAVDLRVSTLPTIHGEKVVMRLLKKDQSVPTLADLGLRDLALRNLETAIKVPHGIILVTGPTGSGKTTTLYSMLHRINTPKVNIMTLEDPVEYQMQGVNQVQINPQAGLTFASGLRSFLRQDPNIIMVGEIRDGETVELAVQASLTGHLVFSTLHTSSAAGAIPRLLDMGAEPFLLASSLTLTMGQRVVRQLNENFKEQYKPEAETIEDIKRVLGSHLDTWCQKNNTSPDKIMLYRAKADRPQAEPEYHGRVAIFEILPITEEMSKMIIKRTPASDIERLGTENGMLLMKQDGYLKALEGITTLEEVVRVAQI